MAEKKSAPKPANGATPKATPKGTPPNDAGEPAKPHELMLMSTAQNASAMEKFGVYGDCDIAALIHALGEKVKNIQDGNMKPVEAMLYGQAQALQSIFTNMARRSGLNAGQHLDATETYMKLALKAQSQCRATLETLAIIKNPQPYIRQANMTTGPQQVNNSYASASGHDGIPVKQTLENNPSPAFPDQYAQAHTGAGDFQSQPNKLLKAQDANILDTGAPSQASRANQTVEAVGKVDRPKVNRG